MQVASIGEAVINSRMELCPFAVLFCLHLHLNGYIRPQQDASPFRSYCNACNQIVIGTLDSRQRLQTATFPAGTFTVALKC